MNNGYKYPIHKRENINADKQTMFIPGVIKEMRLKTPLF